VLCDAGLLEVDVALPPGHPLQEPDVAESYRPLGAAWAAALRSAGVACRLVDVEEARVDDAARRAVARQVCWAGLSPYEVLTPGGSKLVGLSQRRRGGAVLVQCGVLLRGDPARVLDLVRLGADERRAGRRALAGSPALDALAGPSWGDPELAWQRLAPAVTGALGLTSAGTAVTPVPSASS
jgi:lipoate-protein ligase A